LLIPVVEWPDDPVLGMLTHLMISQIPVCMYHGTPAERAELRRTVMLLGESDDSDDTNDKISTPRKRSATKEQDTPSGVDANRTARRSASCDIRMNDTKTESEEDDEDEEESEDEKSGSDTEYKDDAASDTQDRETDPDTLMADGTSALSPADSNTFPVVITTYEIIIKDRIHLAHYNWGYIVVDEGHRLKNLDCKLMKEIKKYPSAGRMILTGTPLHVSFIFCFCSFHRLT
jgi:ATP-dependent DNA helicase